MTADAVASARGLSLHRRGLAQVTGGVVLWSMGGLLARLAGTDSWTTLGVRSVFACLFLLAYIVLRHRCRTVEAFRSLGWPGVIVACCFVTASTAFLTALSYTTVANVLFMQAMAPFLAGLLGWLVMRERVGLHTWIAMATALAGIGVMVYGSIAEGRGFGDLLAVVMTVCTAIAIVLMRRHRQIGMTPAACLATALAVVVAFPFATPASVTALGLGILIVFGCVQMGCGLVLVMAGSRHIPAAETALITVLESILAPLWVWLALGENPGPAALVGGGIVLATLTVHTLIDFRRERGLPPVIGP
jgi:drug/metabolite transporter (DMT)-like permease